MMKTLAPKVYEERFNKKCVTWATDSFLLDSNPNLSLFKGNNPQMLDIKSKLINQRKL